MPLRPYGWHQREGEVTAKSTIQTGPKLRVAASYENVHYGEDYVHLTTATGARRQTLCGRAATVIGSTINPDYNMCPR